VEKSARHFIWVHRVKYDQRVYYKHILHWHKALNPKISVGMIIFRRIIHFVVIKKCQKVKKLAYKFMPGSGKNCQVLIFYSFSFIPGDLITFSYIPELPVNCSDLWDMLWLL